MAKRRARSTVLAALLAVTGLLTMTAGPGAVRDVQAAHGPLVRLVGQVMSIDAPDGSPTHFILQTKVRAILLRIAPRATFTARSAEAEVEGLSAFDYAIVWARHTPHGWTALRIAFDVQPIPVSGQVSMVVKVVRETPNGQHLIVRLDSGAIRWVILNAQTKFRMAGPSTAPPAFAPGESVHMLVRRTPRGWIALEVDMMTTAPQER